MQYTSVKHWKGNRNRNQTNSRFGRRELATFKEYYEAHVHLPAASIAQGGEQ
jgi:hypothetical protein